MEDWVNPRLKELMAIDQDEWTIDFQKEFFDELKESRLLLPVEFTSSLPDFDELKEGDTFELQESLRFKPIKIKSPEGRVIIPLFTDTEEVENFGRVNVLNFTTEDIVDTLAQDNTIDDILINPASDNSMGFPFEAFFGLFMDDKLNMVNEITNLLKEHAVPLKENRVFYLRTPTPSMSDAAEDNVYTSVIPFNASFEDVFHPEYPYLNILLVPKDIFILAIGNIIDDPTKNHDIIIAPIVKFELVEKQDENTFVWGCIEQHFEK